MKRTLNIFYFSKRPEVYALYNLENYYFVIFLNGGYGGRDRIVQITKQSFEELKSDSYNFNQIIDKNTRLKNLDQTLKEYLYFSSSEPYILYEIDNRYFIELWKKQRTGTSQAVKIDEKSFNQLLDETILPSHIL
ncbi:hypothetical protein KPY62_01670 [Psychrobacter sp. TAE2020]|uniref:hypothetical protein n=1 Tax=Psychrobacter sp. TAE2020 TaxID=2846762 RepID=UPI001C0FDF07|nr:hypothetical protein [Psychrobacter sp. TAE2020]MBU5615829.1 hypothetical protein [Psychrobacter sp. TAE2020]